MKMSWFLDPLPRRSRSLRSYLAADDSAAKLRTCQDGVLSWDGAYEVIAFFERGHEREQRGAPHRLGQTHAKLGCSGMNIGGRGKRSGHREIGSSGKPRPGLPPQRASSGLAGDPRGSGHRVIGTPGTHIGITTSLFAAVPRAPEEKNPRWTPRRSIRRR